ncbi:MAG TPA: NAD-dependent deacylase [Enhygromyxa sp.]|nr:NAD-dependent deacylase [Enhygromyxa sp.]
MSESLDLTSHRRIVVLTGAGISVASGLRPYRGPGGLWDEHPELERLATAETARRDLLAIWRAFAPMRPQVLAAEPNAAHLALARFEAQHPDKQLTIITQNVDGLHTRAGSRRVIELHGNIMRTRCDNMKCMLDWFEDTTVPSELPRCPECGEPLRPDVVLFNEAIPAAPEQLSRRALNECDLFLAIGTSGTVSPAANFVRSAEYAGARTIFVNLERLDPPNPMFHESYLGRAEEQVPQLLGV